MAADPWRYVEIPWFVTALGKPPHCKELRRLCEVYTLVEKCSGTALNWFENDDLGISVVLHKHRVDCIIFSFTGLRSPCFLGAHFGMTRESVHRRFGAPDAEIGPKDVGSLSHAGVDRYHRPGFTVALSYACATRALERLDFEVPE